MSADRMEKEMPVLKPCPEAKLKEGTLMAFFRQVPGALQITFEENILLRYVGMTLLAMKKEAFNPKSKTLGWRREGHASESFGGKKLPSQS
eukprot:Skav227873  [mRNA]  locus=scaffold2896:104540:105559:+ [translate_table: standard]